LLLGFHSLQTIRKSPKIVSILFRQYSRLLTSVSCHVLKVDQIQNCLVLLHSLRFGPVNRSQRLQLVCIMFVSDCQYPQWVSRVLQTRTSKIQVREVKFTIPPSRLTLFQQMPVKTNTLNKAYPQSHSS
jgi:hypothetical protein